MTFEIVLMIAAAGLGMSVVPVVHRMIVGPTILDRAVGLDILLVYVVMGLGVYTAHTGTYFAIVPALALTFTGFIGTIALARFVAREESTPADVRSFEGVQDQQGESVVGGTRGTDSTRHSPAGLAGREDES